MRKNFLTTSAAAVIVIGAFGSRAFAGEPQPASGYSVDEFTRMLWLPEAEALNRYVPYEPNESREQLDTALGPVVLRQPRAFSHALGFSPRRAVEEAWNTAAEFLLLENFPEPVRRAPFGWNVIVSNRGPLPVERSRVSSEYCHTAMMGPPADVVIDGFRLLHPCEPELRADGRKSRLYRTLVHEVGHGVEYRLLGSAFSRRQRWHSEGFASWFEAKAVGDTAAMQAKARRAFDTNWRPYLFTGAPVDYAMGYALVGVIAEAESSAGLFRVYTRMGADNCSFTEAVEKELGWSFEDWMKRAEIYLTL